MASPKKQAARTIGREDAPRRMPERADRLEERGPILSRSGEPVTLRITGDQDEFNLEAMGIYPPPGWTYEWKALTIKGQPNTNNLVRYAQNGWEPVPADRHDGLCMPKGYKGNIERGGLGLFERDDRLTAQSRAIDKRNADDAVNNSRSMAGLAAKHGLTNVEFNHGAAMKNTGVKIDRQPRIAERNYEYSVDE